MLSENISITEKKMSLVLGIIYESAGVSYIIPLVLVYYKHLININNYQDFI